MCGIAGQIGRDPRVIQGQYAAYCAMQQTLSRRGPDQRGMFISGRAALIHARLAVVDIENGLQPMQLDWQGESYTLVYNGELYNTPELRTALQNKGHSFTSHSDTEVLLHAFAQWGADCLKRCNGIFAFAVWAQRAGRLFLARDRCGVKPLFYVQTGDSLLFAEGGNLTQCSAISRMFGRKRCLAHLHGQTSGSPAMDTIYGGVLALSEFIRDDYLQNSSLDRRSAYILYNCIDTERFRPAPPPMALRTRLGFGPRDFVMLFCGRLEPDKGIHKLMEALSKLPVPNIRLLIVGSPFFGRTQQSSFLRKLEQQAKALGDRVQFTGYIPNEDLPDYYRLADLVCVPTLVEEAAGLVAMEAMACGRPVLATRSGGMPEYLEGSQAVLVERSENIADQLAWSIRMLYEHPALCAEMGAAGAKRAQDFSVARYYDEFVRIVSEIAQNGGTP